MKTIKGYRPTVNYEIVDAVIDRCNSLSGKCWPLADESMAILTIQMPSSNALSIFVDFCEAYSISCASTDWPLEIVCEIKL